MKPLIHQIFYVSKATPKLGVNGIERIIRSARNFNPDFGITGILLHKGGMFLQLIEGPHAHVRKLFDEKIKKDPRHANLIEVFSQDSPSRVFDGWSMGFHEVSDFDLKLVNEVLSWNRLIHSGKEIDSQLILHVLNRFRSRGEAGRQERAEGWETV